MIRTRFFFWYIIAELMKWITSHFNYFHYSINTIQSINFWIWNTIFSIRDTLHFLCNFCWWFGTTNMISLVIWCKHGIFFYYLIYWLPFDKEIFRLVFKRIKYNFVIDFFWFWNDLEIYDSIYLFNSAVFELIDQRFSWLTIYNSRWNFNIW